jgi:hypothetical protein
MLLLPRVLRPVTSDNITINSDSSQYFVNSPQLAAIVSLPQRNFTSGQHTIPCQQNRGYEQTLTLFRLIRHLHKG